MYSIILYIFPYFPMFVLKHVIPMFFQPVPSRLSPSPKDLDVDATQEQAMKGRAGGKMIRKS